MMTRLLVLLQDGHAIPRNPWNDLSVDEFFCQRFDRGGKFAGKIKLSFTKRVERDGWHVTKEMPQTVHAFTKADQSALEKMAKEFHFDRHAGNQRIVDIKERTRTSARSTRSKSSAGARSRTPSRWR